MTSPFKKAMAAVIISGLGSSLFAGAAYADPPSWAPAHGRYDNRYDRDDRRVVVVEDHHDRRPPPRKVVVVEPRHDWDEHFYYDRHHHRRPYHYYEGRNNVAYAVAPQYAVTEVNCGPSIQSNQLIGAVIGGATGGLVGNQFGKGHGRDAATIGGVIAGLLVGSNIGSQFPTTVDQRCAGQVLETAQTGSQIAWRNPDEDATYAIVPTKTFTQTDGRYCREYQSIANVGGQTQQTYGTACRQPDGSWQIVSQ